MTKSESRLVFPDDLLNFRVSKIYNLDNRSTGLRVCYEDVSYLKKVVVYEKKSIIVVWKNFSFNDL